MKPSTICAIRGHVPESYVYGQRLNKWGRLTDKWGSRCKRCPLTGPEVHRPGLLQKLPHAWRGLKAWLRRNWFRRCFDCNQAEVVLGRRVGDHDGCLPF